MGRSRSRTGLGFLTLIKWKPETDKLSHRETAFRTLDTNFSIFQNVEKCDSQPAWVAHLILWRVKVLYP
jgi:hypothetical protein